MRTIENGATGENDNNDDKDNCDDWWPFDSK